MSQPIAELEKVLTQLVAEHGQLLKCVDAHASAMRTMAVADLAAAGSAIEQSRTRIMFLEGRRRLAIAQIVRLHKVPPTASLAEIAAAAPQYKLSLLKLRDQLKALTTQIARKTNVSGKVAGALLGHLNTAVRLIAGAVKQANVYTKQGTPSTRQRIGVMEAVA
ncbi:MAG TPA: flagellar export chaperone FlgN [Tepidisphaeraceae bacterium]